MLGCYFWGNFANTTGAGRGGGIFGMCPPPPPLYGVHSSWPESTAACAALNADLVMNDTWLQTGVSGLDGGGIHLEGCYPSLPWYNVTLYNNTGQNGAGMNLASGELALTNCLVIGNIASSYAGGLFAFYSGLFLTNVTMIGNRHVAAAHSVPLPGHIMLIGCCATQRRPWRWRLEGLPGLCRCDQLQLCEQHLRRRGGAAV